VAPCGVAVGYVAAMIRMSVSYPSAEGSTFDHEYYKNNHVPLACQTWGVAAEIDKGISGPDVAAVHFFFESTDQMNAALANEGTAAVMEDVKNYTNIAPVMQISEVV
jgi:uncharacterized protein (TIGR02118 family)